MRKAAQNPSATTAVRILFRAITLWRNASSGHWAKPVRIASAIIGTITSSTKNSRSLARKLTRGQSTVGQRTRGHEKVEPSSVRSLPFRLHAVDDFISEPRRDECLASVALLWIAVMEHERKCGLKRLLDHVVACKLVRRSTGMDDQSVLVANNDRLRGAVENLARQFLRRDNFLVSLLLGQIGNDQAQAIDTVEMNRVHRTVGGNLRPIFGAENNLRLNPPFLGAREQSFQKPAVVGRDQSRDRRTDNLFQWRADYLRKAPVAIQNRAIERQGRSAFMHFLQQNAVRVIRAFERINLLARRCRDDQRIDLAIANRLQRTLQLFEALAQDLDLVIARGFSHGSNPMASA